VIHWIEAVIDGVPIDDAGEGELSYQCTECAFEGTVQEALRHMVERQFPA